MSYGRYVGPYSGRGPQIQNDPSSNVAMEDEREILTKGTEAIASQIVTRPLLGSYLPVNPVQRFTFKKWAPEDWNRHNETKKFQSHRDREASRALRDEARELISSSTATANRTQTEVTEKLGERVQGINYWKFELERGIQDMTSEIDMLSDEIRRLEYAIQSTESPMSIARDCLSNRQRRIDTDLVQDDAEIQLLKELEIVTAVRDTMNRTLELAREQQSANRECKHQLEMDWSDKFDAHHLDSKSVSLKNSRGNIMYKAGSAIYKETESDPVRWIEFSQANLRRSEQERDSSLRLRGIIGSTLSQCSQDMREQADRVEEAIGRRVAETDEANRHLHVELKETVEEIAGIESMIASLRETHWEKQKPLKVAQTRLSNRHQRPNIEMCRDEPAHRLVEEVHDLESHLRMLEIKTEEAEDRLRDLQHTRLSLEKELDIKKNSLVIDRDRCLKVRGMFPSTNLLCGYRSNAAA